MQKSLSGWKTTSKHTQPCLSTHHPLPRVLLPFTVQPFEEESVLFTSIYLSSLLPQTSTVWLLPLHVKGFPKAKDVLLVFRCYGNFSVVSCNIWGSPSESLLDFQDMFLSLSLPFSPPHLLPPSLPSSPFLSLSLSLSHSFVCLCVSLSPILSWFLPLSLTSSATLGGFNLMGHQYVLSQVWAHHMSSVAVLRPASLPGLLLGSFAGFPSFSQDSAEPLFSILFLPSHILILGCFSISILPIRMHSFLHIFLLLL